MDDSFVSYGYGNGISYPVRPSPTAQDDYGPPCFPMSGLGERIYECNMAEPSMKGRNGHLHSRASLSPSMVGHQRHCRRSVSAVCDRSTPLSCGDSLYPASLVALDRETKENMGKLKWKLMSSDPRYAHDLRFCHPRRRSRTEVLSSLGCRDEQENKLSIFLPSKEISRSGWTNLSVDVSEDDDRSTVSGTQTTGFGNYCYLCSTIDEHKKHLVQRGSRQKPKHLPKPRIKYVAPPPKVRKADVELENNEDSKEKSVFRVLVKTGKHHDAGTSANVFIQLKGNLGLSKKKQLTRKHSVRFAFGVDTAEVFYVKTADVGSIEAILVEHDGREKRHSWFLESIEILNMATRECCLFSCNDWLSLHSGNKQTKRILRATKTNANSLTGYKVQVFTGSRTMAGTNANVFATFCSRKGTSARMQLKKEHGTKPFQKGSKDVFRLAIKNLGPLTSLRIEHDNTGTAPGWFLEKVVVTDISTGDQYVFPCDQWLALDEGDGKLCRTLQPQNTTGKSLEEIEYKVEVFTGNQMNAGTDANIFVTLYGIKGTSTKVQLKKSTRNNFEKGSKDTFYITTSDVGAVTKLKIEHDNSGTAPGWFLDKVMVTNVSTKQLQTFPCGQWLARDEGDGSLCRVLFPQETTQKKSKQMNNEKHLFKTYDVQVTTGSVSNAGTDANVFITLYGLYGTTTKVQLKNQSRNNFEKGKTDVFEIQAEDIGEISSLRIEHDNSGIGPGWYLEKVTVTDRKSRKSYKFPCGRWLATDEDEGTISRKLYRADDEADDTSSQRSSSVSSVRATRSRDSVRF